MLFTGAINIGDFIHTLLVYSHTVALDGMRAGLLYTIFHDKTLTTTIDRAFLDYEYHYYEYPTTDVVKYWEIGICIIVVKNYIPALGHLWECSPIKSVISSLSGLL